MYSPQLISIMDKRSRFPAKVRDAGRKACRSTQRGGRLTNEPAAALSSIESAIEIYIAHLPRSR